ncbi:MAG: ArsR/SmtB family transcription factor [Candidatus Heimdallarchaeaceae archaeon]
MKVPVCDVDYVNKEAVQYVESKIYSDKEIQNISEIFKILSTPKRLKILFALTFHELCVCDLAAILGTTKSAVSHQLRILRNTNLVKYRKDGKNVFYSLTNKHFMQSILEEQMWVGVNKKNFEGE